MGGQPSIDEVRRYWQENPILGYEAKAGTTDYFDTFDHIKRHDIELFAMDFWGFGNWRGRKVLDIGCGAGWFTVNYALNGALATAVDLTPRAVEMTKRHLEYRGAQAEAMEANAEELPFPDASFDLVHSCGVLHHTPNTLKALSEACRVLKPGGQARIALYYRGLLFSPLVFPLLRLALRLLGLTRPGTDLAAAKTPEEFIRLYDGAENPLGVGLDARQWREMAKAAGFTVDGHEIHFFPKRFMPFSIPGWLHRLLDGWFGTMIYLRLSKK